jgi:alpha-mannosidase
MNQNKKHESGFDIFAIGNAHIDPVWQWNKKEGYQEVLATFRSALARMKEFPSVCFVSSSAQFYEWVEESDPDMFMEIKQRVLEGRWIPVGGWWVECDVNCPSGESLVRQGLYAQKFFMRHFGCKAKVGFSPDTFGHPWTLPQILVKQGMDSYFYMRPEIHEKRDTPAPVFQWVGPDGSSVIAVSIINSYCATEQNIEERITEYIERFSRTLPDVKSVAIFYGVGNHGGGPTISVIRKIDELRTLKISGLHYDSPVQYIESLRPNIMLLPTLRDELQHHARGCYSACSSIKAWDRRASSILIMAEKMASLAHLVAKRPYPLPVFYESWKRVLFNQFHDLLAGTSIEEAYADAEQDYGYALSSAQDIMIKAMHAIVQQIDTSGSAAIPFVVFNPCSWPVTRYVEFETECPIPDMRDPALVTIRNSGEQQTPKEKSIIQNSGGDTLHFQMLPTAAAKQENQPHRIRMLFNAELPALGYQVYRLGYQESPISAVSSGAWAKNNVLENSVIRIEFDTKSGAISSYYDKIRKLELFDQAGAVPVVLNDWDDTWGHRIQAYDVEVGRFGGATFKTIENGPERARLQVKSCWGNSFIVQDFSIYRDSTELACKMTIDWHEKYRVLKMSFPTIFKKGQCSYSIPYGFIQRPMNGDEEPGQTWLDISQDMAAGTLGFAVINHSSCGYSVKDGDIRLTIFHSTAWSHHNPEIVDEGDSCRYMEQGIQEFSYRLIPHEQDWCAARIAQKAEEELFPPFFFATDIHKGHLEKRGSFISTDMANISIAVLKKAEDSDDLILRCVELLGQAAKGRIEIALQKRAFSIEIKPCEIKTFRIPMNPLEEVTETDLLEEAVEM